MLCYDENCALIGCVRNVNDPEEFQPLYVTPSGALVFDTDYEEDDEEVYAFIDTNVNGVIDAMFGFEEYVEMAKKLNIAGIAFSSDFPYYIVDDAAEETLVVKRGNYDNICEEGVAEAVVVDTSFDEMVTTRLEDLL